MNEFSTSQKSHRSTQRHLLGAIDAIDAIDAIEEIEEIEENDANTFRTCFVVNMEHWSVKKLTKITQKRLT